jgi:hypothetical protein
MNEIGLKGADINALTALTHNGSSHTEPKPESPKPNAEKS